DELLLPATDGATPPGLKPHEIGPGPARPKPPMPRTAAIPSAFEPQRVLRAILYHWFGFLVFGSLAAAGLRSLAWTLLPSQYTSYAMLRLTPMDNVLPTAADDKGRSEFITFLKTQSKLITSDWVLRSALNDERLRGNSILARADDKVKFLEEELKVEWQENS